MTARGFRMISALVAVMAMGLMLLAAWAQQP
jgi:hypothetical protein